MRNTLTYQQSTYENDKIKSAQMAVDTSLNERVLDVDTMNATVESETALVPFQQNTPVRFLRGGSQYALWYLAQITRVAPKLWAMSMTSSLGRLTQMPHKGGIYNGVAASVIIDDICGVVPHFVGAAFQNVLLYGWLPYVAPSGENGAQTGSAKDNLLKVLFALNATVRDDAEGTLRIENLSTAVSAQLDADRIYRDNASVVTEPTVTAVTVLEHQYITGSETTTLFEGTTVDGQVIVFREPMSNLTATGFTVTESNANYAVVSAGSGTLTGTPYIHTTMEITKPVTAAAIPNAVRIEDATLVGVTNSSEVVNRLVDYYSHRTYINVDATIDFEDAGDVVEIYDPFDKVLRQACIEKISPLVVSQTMKGRISALVGFTPWQVVPFEDVRELITEDGTWTVSADVPAGTEVQVVLIGGGQGGKAGLKGGTARVPSIITEQDSFTDSITYRKGIVLRECQGGAGGESGEPGAGGKIFRAVLTVNPGDTYQITIGKGGAGAVYGTGTEGDAGTPTTMGTMSSDNGSSSDIGYVDVTTQQVFGAKGAAGIPGAEGAGGKNGTAWTPDPIVVDGVSYTAGVRAGTWHHAGGTSWDSGNGRLHVYGGGGFGGGPAYKANGLAGTTGNGGVSSTRAYVYCAPGGQGATALSPPKASGYGTGGTGGNGGGGGGGFGYPNYVENIVSRSLTPGRLDVYVNTSSYPAATGGDGSDGGEGGDGCVLLLYRRPIAE